MLSKLTATVMATAVLTVILLASNLTMIANAQQSQQQQEPLSNQTGSVDNGVLFQSITDNFRVRLPEGWAIYDVNNTGPALEQEVVQGYGILAQLCPEEQRQMAPGIDHNISRVNTSSSICQRSEGNIVHIVRYPDLGTTVGVTNVDFARDYDNTANAILFYQLEKLQEVGYRDIQIVNSTDTMINLDIGTTALEMFGNDILQVLPASGTIPARLVEMTYSTASAPSETRTGYYLLIATGAASPNPSMVTGYSIFYEGNSTSTSAATATAPTGPLSPTQSVATTVNQLFGSFELIASKETVQVILAALAAQQSGQIPQIVTTQTVQTGIIGEQISPLEGELIANETEGIAPATFKFDINLRGGIKPYFINWDFGDRSSQETDKETVVHTFDEPGTYTATVTIGDNAGQVGEAKMKITVKEQSTLPAAEEEGEDNQNNTSSEERAAENADNTSSEERAAENADNTSSEERAA